MKTRSFFALLAVMTLTVTISSAQSAGNSNPYAIFGGKPNIIGTDYGQTNVFVIENFEEGSPIARIEHNPRTRQIRFFDATGKLVKEQTLGPREYGWGVPDPKAEKYPSVSPYAFCLNNPVRFIDPNGEDVYMFYYTTGNTRSGQPDPNADRMFGAAALTRAIDLLRNGTIKEGDAYVFRLVSDMGQIGSMIESDVAKYSPQFGETAEFSLWSHGSLDGPIGTVNSTGQYAAGQQMTSEGWGDINFNWKDEGARAMFYGCRTASDERGSAGQWARTISSNPNMNNVEVYGQTSRTWPSNNTNTVITPPTGTYPTYMVGGGYSRGGINGAYRNLGIPYQRYPQAKYINGVQYYTR